MQPQQLSFAGTYQPSCQYYPKVRWNTTSTAVTCSYLPALLPTLFKGQVKRNPYSCHLQLLASLPANIIQRWGQTLPLQLSLAPTCQPSCQHYPKVRWNATSTAVTCSYLSALLPTLSKDVVKHYLNSCHLQLPASLPANIIQRWGETLPQQLSLAATCQPSCQHYPKVRWNATLTAVTCSNLPAFLPTLSKGEVKRYLNSCHLQLLASLPANIIQRWGETLPLQLSLAATCQPSCQHYPKVRWNATLTAVTCTYLPAFLLTLNKGEVKEILAAGDWWVMCQLLCQHCSKVRGTLAHQLSPKATYRPNIPANYTGVRWSLNWLVVNYSYLSLSCQHNTKVSESFPH